MPWTARDLVFTINMLKANAPELMLSTDMETWVAEAVAVDELTARIALRASNPRFLFSYFTDCFGNGVRIVPEHIWKDQDPKTFKNLDLAKDWPVVSGPYRLAITAPEQRVWDLRPDWWAVGLGFQRLPKVERIIYLPFGSEAKWSQQLLANEIDSSIDLRPRQYQNRSRTKPQHLHLDRQGSTVRLSGLVAAVAGFQQSRRTLQRSGDSLGHQLRDQSRPSN